MIERTERFAQRRSGRKVSHGGPQKTEEGELGKVWTELTGLDACAARAATKGKLYGSENSNPARG